MPQSKWRQRARGVILRVLAAMPKDATKKQKRDACNAEYPFGLREHHPYKMWCAELRAQLGEPPKRKQQAIVEVSVSPDGVRCGWCESDRGCLACQATRNLFQEKRVVTDWKTWHTWLDRINEDANALTCFAFADWLEEQGWDGEATRMRRMGESLENAKPA